MKEGFQLDNLVNNIFEKMTIKIHIKKVINKNMVTLQVSICRPNGDNIYNFGDCTALEGDYVQVNGLLVKFDKDEQL